ncbi:MAG: Gfo/Idh/MocA family oxidoreductase [Thermoguttaceae bacterium]|jgi:predicted dehydrogenase|nr:Gfo/Idh/MocA family oxidoreductase [Thermoguttaceae bacterium]
MKTQLNLSRRNLLKRSAALGLTWSVPMVVPGHVLGKGAPAPSERITLGVIGYGGRCALILPHFLAFDDVRCIAVSDCRVNRLAAAKHAVDTHYGNEACAAHADFRELLARADVDSVLIATGDRWHAPLSILAAKAGKDIFCEKPVSMTVGEGRALVDTTVSYGTVYQACHQRRSVAPYRFQAEVVRKGMIGEVHTIICQVWEGPTVAYREPTPVPEGFDYDMWLGPTPWRPYNEAYVRGWNYFWDVGGGPLIGMGCHYTDLAQWALLRDDTGPVDYEGTATWKADAYSETPVTAECTCTYADGIKILLRSSGTFADRYIRFVGSEGWVQVDDHTNAVTTYPESIRRDASITAQGYAQTGDHVRNWLDCIKSRSRPICHPESAHRANTICHAVNIGLRLGRSLKWDPQAERFLDDDQANAKLHRALRPPWTV